MPKQYVCDGAECGKVLKTKMSINKVRVGSVFNPPVTLYLCYECASRVLAEFPRLAPLLSWTARH